MTAPAATLYAVLMGRAFEGLAPAVREFHGTAGRVAFDGWVETVAPRTRLALWLARWLGTPLQGGSHPIRFELDARPDLEIWTRHFLRRTMRSRMAFGSGCLVERLGYVQLHFELSEQGGALRMHLREMRCLGLRCPRWLLPRVRAIEIGEGRRLHFDVQGDLPFIGLVAAYRGHLDLSSARPWS